jgi:signal transduction histidine kinase
MTSTACTHVIGKPVDDPVRLAALHETELLDSPPEAAFDRFTDLVCRSVKCQVSLVSLVDINRQFFKSARGLPAEMADLRETPLTHSFCQHVVKGGRPLVVNDAKEDPRVCDNLAVSELGVIAYLGVPILTEDNLVLGSLCAIDTAPREWTSDEVETMEALAEAVGSEIRLRTLTQRLRESVDRLEESQRERDEMLHILLHDLRNPVGAVITCLTMLEDKPDGSDEKTELMQICRQSSKECLNLLNSLVTKNRDESGGYRLQREPIEVAPLLRHIYQLAKPQADYADHTLSVTYPEATLPLQADSSLLARVLMNLLSNAIKYTPSGGTIHLSAQLSHDQQDWVFEVEDNGPGIPEDKQHTLFEKYATAGSPLRSGDTSFGLGLYFCKKAVEAHQGVIEMTTKPDGGSRFTVTLPAI